MSTLMIPIHMNGDAREVPAGTTVTQLLQIAGYGERRVAVERNGEIVPRSQHAGTLIESGDRLEIVHAIGGG
jgi:sulfur carrier protein